MKKNTGIIKLLSVIFPEVAVFLYYMEDNKTSEKAKALLFGLKIWFAILCVTFVLMLFVILLPIILNIFSNL